MASLSILLNKTAFAVGEEVVATLVVSGADPENRVVLGTCTVDGVELNAEVNFTLTHTVANQDVYGFTQDAGNPNVFRKPAA